MKKEDFVTTFVMLAVCTMMLVGVTIAWYTGNKDKPTVTNMEMEAEDPGDIKIALKEGGPDIEELEGDAKYVVIGLEELTNIENKKMAPGAFGEVKFWVTPLKESITGCQIVPSVDWVTEADGTNESGSTGNGTDEDSSTDNNTDSEENSTDKEKDIKTLVNEHIAFFSDEDMTIRITEDNPASYDLDWKDGAGVEEEITIYWQWYYEYPFNEDGDDTLSESARQEKIKTYDLEDTRIGTEVDKMSFHFVFKSQ